MNRFPPHPRTSLALCVFLTAACLTACSAKPTAPPVSAAAPRHILGIFGGMGPEATANLYQELVRLTPAQKDQDHIPTLIYSFPQVPDRTTAIKNHDRTIVPYLVEGVTRLERAGASLIVIPCNTAHYFYDDMQRAVNVPILHMIRETADAVVTRHPRSKTVGLLATDGTIQTGLYEKELRARGLAVVYPDEAIQKTCVMKAVYGIKAGSSKKVNEDLLFAAGKNLEEKGAEVIVLGCTEIPLAFNPDRAKVPVVNATRVLAESAIRAFGQQDQ
jgi:aspartate racemase